MELQGDLNKNCCQRGGLGHCFPSFFVYLDGCAEEEKEIRLWYSISTLAPASANACRDHLATVV